jgi:hypothetical protein
VAEEIPPGGTEVSDPTWDPWRPGEAAQRLARVSVPWYVAGGWALDLFRGEQTREHGDLEIAVPAPDFVGTLPLLNDDAVGWLRRALAQMHPGHPWIGALGEAGDTA